MHKSDHNVLTVNVRQPNGSVFGEEYKLLNTFEFNSDRKRMSVILQRSKR